jgi:hypothetical protein
MAYIATAKATLPMNPVKGLVGAGLGLGDGIAEGGDAEDTAAAGDGPAIH